MQNQKQSQSVAAGLTVLSSLGRLLPHVPNVTPLGGSCLFAGSRLSGPLAYLLPLVVMLITDPFLGGYTKASPAVYAALLVNVWIGRRLLRDVSAIKVGGAAFLCSLQFFLVTNLAQWYVASHSAAPLYTADAAGLANCFTLAIPFWGRTLAGDLFFSAAIFGVYELISRACRVPQQAQPQA